ncbi:helix-turn-helix domain-containing protein [Roseburia hominis]|uniref:helix-turn-helix domain-containing protein n=1 Tax=Roseburia hominis TaxID=301301 RepID=UPI003AB81C8F
MNERIRNLRKYLGLTMEKFGEQLGVGKTAISNIENGNRNVTEQMCKSICREYNVNEVWLRTGTGEMFVVHKDETAAIISDLLESINNKSYDFILDVLKVYQTLPSANQDVIKNFCQQLIKERKNRKE